MIHLTSRLTALRISQVFLFLSGLTPLLFYRPIFQYYTAPKAFLLFAISEIVFVILLWCVQAPSRKPARRPILVALIFFVLIQIVAALLGEDPWNSFWSQPGRMTGVFLLTHLLLLFFAMTSLLRTTLSWRMFFSWNIIVGLVVSFLYWFPLFPELMAETNGGSTLGNSSVFGTYLLFLLGFSLFLLFDRQSGKGVWAIAAIGAIVFGVTLFATDARASQISLVGGGILALSLALIRLKTQGWMRRIGWMLITLLTASFLWISILVFTPGSIVQERFVEMGDPTRLILWDMAWQAIQERPLLGWGPENFSSVSLLYYNPCLGSAACGEGKWSDRAHNIFLDTAVGSGLIGLLAYVAIFLVVVHALWKKHPDDPRDGMISIIIMALLASYVVQNLTSFDSVVSLWCWMVVLAFAQWKVVAPSSIPISIQDARPIAHRFLRARLIPLLATVLLAFGLWYFVIQPAMGFGSLSASVQAQTIDDRLKFYNRAISVSRAGLPYRRSYMAYETSARLWYATPQQLTSMAPGAQQEIRLAKMALTDTLDRTPNYLRASLMLARIYQVESRLFRPSALQDAQEVLKKSVELNPQNPLPLWALSSVLVESGDVEGASATMQQAFSLNPHDPKAHLARTVTLLFVGDEASLQKAVQESLEQFPEMTQQLQSIAMSDPIEQRRTLLDSFY